MTTVTPALPEPRAFDDIPARLEVLVVEDDPDDAYLAVGELQGAGCRVAVAESLAEALRQLTRATFDAVVLDLGLPDSSGLQALSAVLEVTERPVVVLTGLDDPDVGLSAVVAGAQDYVLKGGAGRGPLARTVRYAVERGRLQRELLAAQERYRRIVDTTLEGVWVVDNDLRTTLVNQRFADMLGYGRDEMIGRPIREFLADEAQDVTSPAESADVPLGPVEVRWSRKDGTDLWALLTMAGLTDGSGEVAGSFAMLTDVTGSQTFRGGAGADGGRAPQVRGATQADVRGRPGRDRHDGS